SADAGQDRQVPVKPRGDTRIQLFEDAPSRWLRCLDFRYHLAPPRGRLNTAAGDRGWAPPPVSDGRIPARGPPRPCHTLSVPPGYPRRSMPNRGTGAASLMGTAPAACLPASFLAGGR